MQTKMKTKQNGSAILIILVGILGLVAISAFAYYKLKLSGKLGNVAPRSFSTYTPMPSTYEKVSSDSAKPTPSDDTNSIEMDMKSINEGSVDTDVKDLETSAKSL